MSDQHDNKTRRPSPSFYLLLGLVLVSAWQYHSIGAITWPTRVASEADRYVSRTISRVRALLPGRDIEWSDGRAERERGRARSGEARIEWSGSAPARSATPAERPAFLSRARVLKVVDGDSLEIDLDGKETRVRLQCIDAPEYGQAYGNAARRHLAAILESDTVLVEGSDRDTYGRLLAKIYTGDDDTSLNWRMVRAGYAWDNTRFTCGAAYTRAEERARSEQAGLWQDRGAVPPWEWRRSARG